MMQFIYFTMEWPKNTIQGNNILKIKNAFSNRNGYFTIEGRGKEQWRKQNFNRRKTNQPFGSLQD
jgi:hypothetical protein